MDARLALRCATLASERVLADLDGRAPGQLTEPSRSALADVPDAMRWAEDFARDLSVSLPAFRRHGAPRIVHGAVKGIAWACIPSPDEMLHGLLAAVIDECAVWAPRDTGSDARFDPAVWAAARRRGAGRVSTSC